jgi:hypothetical protein
MELVIGCGKWGQLGDMEVGIGCGQWGQRGDMEVEMRCGINGEGWKWKWTVGYFGSFGSKVVEMRWGDQWGVMEKKEKWDQGWDIEVEVGSVGSLEEKGSGREMVFVGEC